ncbi:MAG: serine protease [Patescibacteria group bacterium]
MATMEELTKTQMVLLTLLVSFVTSIATGIITVSLLAQAPASVTQTINRVVEHTIEKVAPASPSTNTTVKEVTVVKEEDAIISSIDKSAQAVVRIKSPLADDGSQSFYALGVLISKDGLVVSDKRNLILNGTYSITLADGTTLPATVSAISEDDNLTLFRIKPDPAHVNSFKFITFSPNELKLGQTIIAVEGRDKNTVGIGRVLSISSRTEKDAKGNDLKVPYTVDTDIGSGEIQGSPLFNLSGELVGIKTSSADLVVPSGLYTTSIPMKRVVDKAK